MTLEEFKASIAAEQADALKSIMDKPANEIKTEEAEAYKNYITQSANALGDDQIAEPMRYIAASVSGLRTSDLKALIGDDFDENIFEQWVKLLGFPILWIHELPNASIYDLTPVIHNKMRDDLGTTSFKSCASDIGYYLLEHKEMGDPIRDVQCIHLLLDGGETAAAAELLSSLVGEPLHIATRTLGQAFKDGPDDVQKTVLEMPWAQGEKVNRAKIISLLANDCQAFIGDVNKQNIVLDSLHQLTESLIAQGAQDITVLLGVIKLRKAQNARFRQQEEEAKNWFVQALDYLLPPLRNADPLTITKEQVLQYWLCLKICQEMGQPKAIATLFESIIKVEQAQTQDDKREVSERTQIAEDIMAQHIDMSKLYYMMPKQLQEQFVNYAEPTIALLQAYLKDDKNEKSTEDEQNPVALANYYQVLGELYAHLSKNEESHDALVEAQILQMRQLGNLQKRDGDTMSPEQLVVRLGLSVTNHMLAGHYRTQSKSQHDLMVALTSNMDMATDCFKAFSHDGRVIHFLTNAALELGDAQHRTGGLLAECGTYEKAIKLMMPVLNNMRLDQQLCQDLAMLHTKCGQAQSDSKIRRYSEALRNLEMAQRLWNSLAQSTNNPEFKKNMEIVTKLIAQLKH